MSITLIIGKASNLSVHLNEILNTSVLISSRDIGKNIDVLSVYKEKRINIIFNNFQSSIYLNNLENTSEYIENSILITAQVLDYFKESDIDKIIYTSSSSVYGNNILCSETDEVKPLNLHSSLKIANEKLIEKFCSLHNINFTITRIFNMYGGDDKFSVISKILNAVRNNKEITIVNGGNAIRDFIHIDDVVDIYSELLNVNVKLLNIGTGNGVSIKSLIDFLHYRGVNLKVKNIQRDELKISTADVKLLKETLHKNTFKELEEYLSDELHI